MFYQGAQDLDGCGLQATSEGPNQVTDSHNTLGTSPTSDTALSQRGSLVPTPEPLTYSFQRFNVIGYCIIPYLTDIQRPHKALSHQDSPFAH